MDPDDRIFGVRIAPADFVFGMIEQFFPPAGIQLETFGGKRRQEDSRCGQNG